MKIKVRLIGNGWQNKGDEVDAEITNIRTTHDGAYWAVCENFEIEPVISVHEKNIAASLVDTIGVTPKTIAIEF